MVIGGGVSGTNAAQIASGFGANVTVLDINVNRLKELENQFNGQINTLLSNAFNIEQQLLTADLVIGAVLVPGRKAPTLVSREMVKNMPDKSVIVDIAIDQGGIFETSASATTHDHPTYEDEGVIHYAVANMPGAVAQTATYALSNMTLPYIKQIANESFLTAIQENIALYRGVNTYQGHLVELGVADDLSLPGTPLETLI